MQRLKGILADRLTEVERVVILSYAELGTVRKVAERLGVSSTTAFYRIKAVQAKVRQLEGELSREGRR